MEIRRDPITQSWVVVGHRQPIELDTCPFERPAIDKQQTILSSPADGTWQVRVLAHPDPLYRIEGEPGRLPDGMYDRMGSTGAHEIVVETPDHNKRLAQLSDEEIDRVLSVWVSRIADLKKDLRLKYVAVFKNQGELAGEEWPHSHSEITGTIFVPRRIKYELRAAREWFKEKERCVFCDIVRQEEKKGTRIVDVQGDYYALCPYASRVPYEVWLLHRRHNHLFEQPKAGANRRQLAALMGSVLRRLEKISPAYHWWCTPRQILAAKKVNSPDIGKRWPTIFTGTSRYFRSWKSAASPTASKRLISTRWRRSRLPSSFAQSIPTHETGQFASGSAAGSSPRWSRCCLWRCCWRESILRGIPCCDLREKVWWSTILWKNPTPSSF